METTEVSLKLLVDTKNKRVLFAEAGKEFVDFLFFLLSLPIGTVIRLLNKNNMVGCLGNLYSSVKNLSETYMQPNQSKDTVLNPKAPVSVAQMPLLLAHVESAKPKLYMCPIYHLNVSHDRRAVCPECKKRMNAEVTYIAPSLERAGSNSAEGGFVKGIVTYMVMDNLVVELMSTISGITMLNKFNIKEVGSLEEKVVHITMAEGLKLLQHSLQIQTVLTAVFLGSAGA